MLSIVERMGSGRVGTMRQKELFMRMIKLQEGMSVVLKLIGTTIPHRKGL